jgi:hypothetical protein
MTLCQENGRTGTRWMKNNARRFKKDGWIDNHNPTTDDYGIRFLYVRIPFGREQGEGEASKFFRDNVGLNIESVIVTYQDRGGNSHTYDLINELGYALEYRSDGLLYVELSDPYPENSIAFEYTGKFEDAFTKDITEIFWNSSNSHENRYKGRIDCSITLTAIDIGRGLDGEYDSIGRVTFNYNGSITFRREPNMLDDEDDD